MTDERVIPLPAGDTSEKTDTDERRDAARGEPRPTSDEEENPLLKEGPDAPDAADIEDPDEQL
jgi:hypothetical protein